MDEPRGRNFRGPTRVRGHRRQCRRPRRRPARRRPAHLRGPVPPGGGPHRPRCRPPRAVPPRCLRDPPELDPRVDHRTAGRGGPAAGRERAGCSAPCPAGVDSAVAAALMHKAIGDQLTCVFVDTGLMRAGEAEQVEETFRRQFHVDLVHVKAADRFFGALAGVTDPERKRKIIGELFIRIFEEVARDLGAGTGGERSPVPRPGDPVPRRHRVRRAARAGGRARQHQVPPQRGRAPRGPRLRPWFEPLRLLFKDEVRAVGEELGLPHDIVWRQPLPRAGFGGADHRRGDPRTGPRSCGPPTRSWWRRSARPASIGELWQSFAVLPAVRTVGVMGDGRTYAYPVVIRAVTSDDAMTARLGPASLRPGRADGLAHHQRGRRGEPGGPRRDVEAPRHHRVGVSAFRGLSDQQLFSLDDDPPATFDTPTPHPPSMPPEEAPPSPPHLGDGHFEGDEYLQDAGEAATSNYVDRLVEDLNPGQRAAVEHRGGPLLVVAGAGSGKTRVLTRRIAHLLAAGDAAPWEILAITFTNKAADEMRKRVAELVGPRAERMWVSTFHSACLRILRSHASRLGYQGAFTVYDDTDSRRLIEIIVAELGLDPKRLPPPLHRRRHRGGQVRVGRGSRLCRGGLLRGRSVPAAHRPTSTSSTSGGCWRPTPWTSTTCCSRAVRVLQTCDDVRQSYQERFTQVLVDEYQDTNRAQNELVILLGRGPRQRDRGGGLGPVGLQVARRRHPQHPGVRGGLPQRHHGHARAELPVDPDHPRRRQRRDRQQHLPAAQAAVHRGRGRRSDLPLPGRGRARRGTWGGKRDHAAADRRAGEPRATWPSSTGPTPRAG